MEFINAAIKKYVNFTLFDLILFSLSGLGFYYVFQTPTFLTFLNSSSKQKDISSFPVNVFFLLFWVLLYIFAIKLIEIAYKFFSSFRIYKFKSSDWPRKWDFQGNVRIWKLEKNVLNITDSQSGCILKNHYWKNLELTFQCMFPLGTDDQVFGIIFRAQSLSDYFMIQIHNNSEAIKKKIIPHIRMEGNWETTRHSTYDLNLNLIQNDYSEVKLKVLNEKVELSINGVTCLDWIIPTNSDLKSGNKNARFVDTIVPKINFRKSYGRIGFRAAQGEQVVIKGLLIKRLPGIL